MSFRKHPKASLEVRIPVEIVRAVGLRAVNEGKRHNRVVAELLCKGLGIDPAKYGLEPSREDRVTASSPN